MCATGSLKVTAQLKVNLYECRHVRDLSMFCTHACPPDSHGHSGKVLSCGVPGQPKDSVIRPLRVLSLEGPAGPRKDNDLRLDMLSSRGR